MRETNTKLAQKIVSKLAQEPTKAEVVTQIAVKREANEERDTIAKNLKEKTESVWSVSLVALGYAVTFDAPTKHEAVEKAVQYVAKELDSGKLVLADNWEKNNLR